MLDVVDELNEESSYQYKCPDKIEFIFYDRNKHKKLISSNMGDLREKNSSLFELLFQLFSSGEDYITYGKEGFKKIDSIDFFREGKSGRKNRIRFLVYERVYDEFFSL